MNKFLTLIVGLSVGLVLTGCATPNTQPLNVTDLLNTDKPTPDNQFDFKSVSSSEVGGVKIVTATGKPVNPGSIRSALFEAYWCPHCQRTLVLLNAGKNKLKNIPVIVSTGFPKGTSLKQAVATSDKELKMLGIHGFKVYYALGENKQLVTGFPTLLFTHSGQRVRLVGEHTFDVWRKALS